jgi:NTE family protein
MEWRGVVSGSRVVLVLGGGGMKGLAHVGAWRAVVEAGVEVSAIVGTSIGALVGACIAGGAEQERLAMLARALQKTDIVTLNRWALLFNGIRQPSVFRDDVFRAYIDSVLPVRSFGELGLPLSINAVDLEDGREEWFGASGREDVDLAEAVYASCALPVFYPPALIGDHHYVDGGIADALPIRRAAALGADRIIAIDVGAGPTRDSADTVAQGMVAIHHRAMQIMGYERKRLLLETWSGPELVYVRPDLDAYATFDFGSTEYFLEEGYRAARQALAPGEDAATRQRAG